MDTKTGELILADIALCVDTVDKVIWRVETEPLTPETVSKRHTRILTALCDACDTTLNTWVHADLHQIRELVAMKSNKRYSPLDISAFTFDLAKRGYVNHVNHEDYGEVFAILPRGVELLENIQLVRPGHFEGSRTPNFYFGVRQ